jgi:hypothetical protein
MVLNPSIPQKVGSADRRALSHRRGSRRIATPFHTPRATILRRRFDNLPHNLSRSAGPVRHRCGRETGRTRRRRRPAHVRQEIQMPFTRGGLQVVVQVTRRNARWIGGAYQGQQSAGTLAATPQPGVDPGPQFRRQLVRVVHRNHNDVGTGGSLNGAAERFRLPQLLHPPGTGTNPFQIGDGRRAAADIGSPFRGPPVLANHRHVQGVGCLRRYRGPFTPQSALVWGPCSLHKHQQLENRIRFDQNTSPHQSTRITVMTAATTATAAAGESTSRAKLPASGHPPPPNPASRRRCFSSRLSVSGSHREIACSIVLFTLPTFAFYRRRPLAPQRSCSQ